MSKLGTAIKFSKGTCNFGAKVVKGVFNVFLGQIKEIKRGVHDTKAGFKMIKEIRAAKAKSAETQGAASAERLDENSDEIKAWRRIKDKLKDQPIPSVQNTDISDEEIKLVLPLMRKRIKWAENHPSESDPYEALGSDYQDHYATLQQLADMRGIVVDDLPEK